LGEIRLPWKRELFDSLSHGERDVSLEAAFALTKLGEPKGFAVLLDHFLTVPPDEFEHLRHFFHRLKPKAKRMVKQMLTQAIAEEVQSLGSHFNTETVEKLKRLYILLDEHEELFALEELMKEQSVNK
jgi:hypothetical protein